MEQNGFGFEDNNNYFDSDYNSVPFGIHQLHHDFLMWNAHNPNFWGSVQAYRTLNERKVEEEFIVASIDLTEEPQSEPFVATSKEEKVISPTQARDFKLFCQNCNRCFTSKKRLQNHVLKCSTGKIAINSPKMFSCKVCSKSFMKRAGLFKHNAICREVEKEERIEVLINQAGMNVHHDRETQRKSIFHSIDLLAKSDAHP